MLNKQCFCLNSVRRQKLQHVLEVQFFSLETRDLLAIAKFLFSLETGLQLFCYSFIALSVIRCSKSVQKFAVLLCVKSLPLLWKPRSWF